MALRSIEREFETPLIVKTNGKTELSIQILQGHQALCDRDGVENPYFYLTEGNREKMFIEEELGNGLTKRIGILEAFNPEEIAHFLKTAQNAYTAQKPEEPATMGDFPTDKEKLETQKAEQELTKIFIGGFTRRTAIIVIDKQNPNGTKDIVGGLIIKAGSRKVPIYKLIGKSDTSISTFSALNFDLPEGIGSTLERNTFCASKLFSVSEDRDDKKKILPELVVGAEEARVCLERHLKRPLVLGIADIHDDRLLKFVSNFGWGLLTDQTRPTDQILSTILKHHYDYFSREGRKIKVIWADRMLLRSITEEKLASSPQRLKLLY